MKTKYILTSLFFFTLTSLFSQVKTRDVGVYMTGNATKIVEFDRGSEGVRYVLYYQNLKYQHITDIRYTTIGDIDALKEFIYACDSLLNTVNLKSGENLLGVNVGTAVCSVDNFMNQTVLTFSSDDDLGYGMITKAVLKRFKKSLSSNGIEIVGYGE